MWPWESALTGFGEFQWNDDDEIHISGDVANAFRLYYWMTKNDTWLQSSGWPVIRDSADFFASRAVACDNSSCILGGQTGATTTNLTYLSVVSPDESAGPHDSSAYTNGIAITVLDFALEAARLLGEAPGANWSSVSERLYMPIVDVPDGFMAGTPIHTEFHGYSQKTHPHINQADVTLLQYPLGLRSNKRVFPPLPNSKNPEFQLAINDLLFWQPKSDNQVFYTGDSSNSIAWLEMGNRSAADAQFDLAFTHMDLEHFNVFEEKNSGDFGHLNFITGAGGYLQNIINGYFGLRYTPEGLNLRPVLPPHGVTAVKLRALSLGSSRMDVVLTANNITVTLLEGNAINITSHGVSDKVLFQTAGHKSATLKLCKNCGCGCPAGGCGCLSISAAK
jgi:trehalose/maltose hydrolase-like predicted phosphorylase